MPKLKYANFTLTLRQPYAAEIAALRPCSGWHLDSSEFKLVLDLNLKVRAVVVHRLKDTEPFSVMLFGVRHSESLIAVSALVAKGNADDAQSSHRLPLHPGSITSPLPLWTKTQSPWFGVGRKGSARFVPILFRYPPFLPIRSDLHSLFSGIPRLVPICSDFFRILPICFQNRNWNRPEPFQEPRPEPDSFC